VRVEKNFVRVAEPNLQSPSSAMELSRIVLSHKICVTKVAWKEGIKEEEMALCCGNYEFFKKKKEKK
jgi:hypothetical protein